MSDLSKKKRIRAANRTYARKIVEATEGNLKSVEPSSEELDSNKRILEQKLELIRKLDNDIMELMGEDESADLEKEIEESSEFGRQVSDVVRRVELLFKENAKPEHQEATERQPEIAGGSNPVIRPKLPKLHIKKYAGDPKEWQSFWDSFNSAVHTNPSLQSVDKFNYLRGLLEGTALAAITGLSLTESNYGSAIKVLNERFGNKQLIISSHMESLLQLSPVTSITEIKKIRVIYDNVEANVRGLDALGIASETYGSLLVPVMMNKLPEELRLIITRHFKSGVWNLSELLETLKGEIEARERCSFMSKANGGGQEPKRGKGLNLPTAATLVSSAGGQEQNSPSCTYCGKFHPSANCSVITDVSARRNVLRKKGRCFVCLKANHISRNCHSSSRCFKCGGRHHQSICGNYQRASRAETSDGTSGASPRRPLNSDQPRPYVNSEANNQMSTLYIDARTSVLLQTAQALASGTDGKDSSVKVRVILDSCSQRSYVSTRLKEALDLPVIRTERLMIKTFGTEEGQIQQCEVVQVCLKGLNSDLGIYLTAYVVPIICAPLQNQAIEVACQKYPHLNGVRLADDPTQTSNLEVDILVGADHYWSLVTGEVKRGRSGPVALKTRLGWVLSGSIEQRDETTVTAINCMSAHTLRTDTCHIELENQLTKFWELETIGIKQENDSVHDKFLDNLTFNGDRYEVRLPWRDSHPELPDNYQGSVKRLESQLRRLKQQPSVLHEYDHVIRDQLNSGIIEEIPEAKINPCGKVHYLPHHAVIRHDKETTKLRVVYDASASVNGVSLNSCLHAGPSLLPRLMDILMRFRLGKIALTADIEKAFLMVAVKEEDRDVLRFLWVDDVSKENPNIVERRFTRVVFGVNSSPFLLNGTLKHHISQYEESDPEFVSKVLQSLYVDDLSTGEDEVPKAFTLYRKAKSRMREGGFNLRKWMSNSAELLELIESEEGTTAPVDPGLEEDETYANSWLGPAAVSIARGEDEHKLLGVIWNPKRDTLVTRLNIFHERACELPATKRSVLRITSSIYDPLGLISPVVISMKILFQVLCVDKKQWDELLEGGAKTQWSDWITDLREVQDIAVPRCYMAGTDGEVLSAELHGFSDASNSAYAAAVYVRLTTETETVTSLVASKTRVAPLAKQTIPRLELLGAVILSRLMVHVKEALEKSLKIDRMFCWTDSMVALYWITGGVKEWKQFVQNRVDDIRRHVSPTHWRFCPGSDNPADLPSRGVKASVLAAAREWWEGPVWLRSSQETWPSPKSANETPEEALQEIKSHPKKRLEAAVNMVATTNPSLGHLIKSERCSNAQRLFKITAYVLRFIHNARAPRLMSGRRDGPLATDEVMQSELKWVKELQGVFSPQKLKQLEGSLGPFRDSEGIIRCQGRLMKADLPYATRCPALIPDSHLTNLIIRACHERVMHNGVKETLAELRTHYWLVKGRQVVKREIAKCNKCRKLEGRHYAPPPTAQLPRFRLEEGSPFMNVGVDFLGPVYLKTSTDAKSAMSKAYVALYTCATTRAVHLELTPSLNTQAFLRSLRRFISRRGVPGLVVSDNFKSFKTASGQLRALFEAPEITSALREWKIKWRFNLAKAPWWGGFFERLIKSTKRCMKKQLGNARLTYEELLTVLAEVEAVLNSRPLTYVDTEDVEEPLTPSHLLIGKRLLSLPDDQQGCTVPGSTQETITKRARYQQTLATHFWTRWQREYLLSLREHHRLESRRQKTEDITVGDVVIVHEDNIRRNFWRLGKIERLIRGGDGVVRGAAVKIGERGKRSTVLQRPIQKLYPLETRQPTPSVPQELSIAQRLPRRGAADRARQNILNS